MLLLSHAEIAGKKDAVVPPISVYMNLSWIKSNLRAERLLSTNKFEVMNQLNIGFERTDSAAFLVTPCWWQFITNFVSFLPFINCKFMISTMSYACRNFLYRDLQFSSIHGILDLLRELRVLSWELLIVFTENLAFL